MMNPRILAIFVFLSCALPLFSACGKDSLAEAKRMERLGRYPSALASYEKKIAQDPSGAAEARYRSAEIYRTVFRDYPKARAFYAEVSARHPGTSWSGLAQKALAHCPDYFPLQPDFVRRTGDSQSGGKYMQTEDRLEALAQPAGRFRMKRTIYAGDRIVSTFERIYEKTGNGVNEYPLGSAAAAAILSFPIEPGKQWETIRDGKKTLFKIEGDDETVAIQAGEFTHCLKLRIQNAPEDESWKLEYYAPDVGFVLASVGTANGESRVSELMSYQDKKLILNPPAPSALAVPAAPVKPGLWQKLTTRFRKKPAAQGQ